MSSYELWQEDSMELPDEIGLSSLELVGDTEVSGFEANELITNEQVAEHLRENIPPTHLEHCPSIEYDPKNPMFWNAELPGYASGTQAYWVCRSHDIHVGPADGQYLTWNPQSGEWVEQPLFESETAVLETISHEVGHNAYNNLIEPHAELVEQWRELYRDSDPQTMAGFVSDYATTNEDEDFAESYRTYIHDPELLLIVSPEKYDFMQEKVFYGREYF